MKRYLKGILPLALVLVLAGAISMTASAHRNGCHTKRAKSRYAVTFTTNRGAVDTLSADPDTTAAAAEQTAYAPCYENGFCSQNNACDVNGVCQNGGICNGAPCADAPCWQDGTCLQDGICDVNGVCQNGGSCYWAGSQNNSNGSNDNNGSNGGSGSYGGYGHHGGHHGGRHHR